MHAPVQSRRAAARARPPRRCSQQATRRFPAARQPLRLPLAAARGLGPKRCCPPPHMLYDPHPEPSRAEPFTRPPASALDRPSLVERAGNATPGPPSGPSPSLQSGGGSGRLSGSPCWALGSGGPDQLSRAGAPAPTRSAPQPGGCSHDPGSFMIAAGPIDRRHGAGADVFCGAAVARKPRARGRRCAMHQKPVNRAIKEKGPLPGPLEASAPALMASADGCQRSWLRAPTPPPPAPKPPFHRPQNVSPNK